MASCGCEYKCDGRCEGNCTGACVQWCGHDCGGDCSGGCGGSCMSGCTGGCSGTCSGTCTGCSGTCSGTCQGCTGCTSSCSSHCDNACTAANQAEVIANIGGNIIRATDFTSLKTAIEKEYQRRGKAAPPAYNPAVAIGNVISLNAISQVFNDCYNINPSSANDWRGTVSRGDPVYASKIQPCVTFIKGLSTQITVK